MDNIAQSFESLTYFNTDNAFNEDEKTFEGFSVNDKSFNEPDIKKIVKAFQMFPDDKLFDESFYKNIKNINSVTKKSHKLNDKKKMKCSTEKEKVCLFCHQAAGKDDRKVELGELRSTKNVSVHYYCLLFSSALVQNGADDEGIEGFLEKDILVEIKRGSKLKCSFCKLSGATIGCNNKKCKKRYHFPCGLDNYTQFDFASNFVSLCADDRNYQIGDNIGEEVKCQICKEDMKADPRFAMWLSCCQLGKKEKGLEWFHIICMKKLGLSAGLQHFRCPLCSYESAEFKKELQQNGIFMPERDASWELEPNAFSDLNERPNQCNVSNCKRIIEESENRSEEEDNKKKKKRRTIYTKNDWELVICSICGSECAHRVCVDLPTKCNCEAPTCEEFQCSLCQDGLRKFNEIKQVKKEKSSCHKRKVKKKFKRPKTKTSSSKACKLEYDLELPVSRTDSISLTRFDVPCDTNDVHIKSETILKEKIFSLDCFNSLVIRELERNRYELPSKLSKMKFYAENLSLRLVRLKMDENDVLESINGITSDNKAAVITIDHIKKFMRCSFNFMQMQVMKQLLEFVFLQKIGIAQNKLQCPMSDSNDDLGQSVISIKSHRKSLDKLLEKCKFTNILERKSYLSEDENFLADLPVTEVDNSHLNDLIEIPNIEQSFKNLQADFNSNLEHTLKHPQSESASCIEQSLKDPEVDSSTNLEQSFKALQSVKCHYRPMQNTQQYENCATCYKQLIPGIDKTSVILSTGELQILCSKCSSCQRIKNIFPKWNFVNSLTCLSNDNGSNLNIEHNMSTDDSSSEISDSELSSHFNKKVESQSSIVKKDQDSYTNADNSLHEISNNLLVNASCNKLVNSLIGNFFKNESKEGPIVKQVSESKENCVMQKVLPNSSNQITDNKKLSINVVASDMKNQIDFKDNCDSVKQLDCKDRENIGDNKNDKIYNNNTFSQPERNKRKFDQDYTPQKPTENKLRKLDDEIENQSRTSGVSATSSNKPATCNDSQSQLPKRTKCESNIRSELKKVRINRSIIITDEKKILAPPPIHECSSFHLETSKKVNCEMCKYAGRDLTNFRIESKEWFQCFSCKNKPKFCSMNHYDQWHTVEHNWMILPDTPKEKNPTRICKLCKDQKFTRFYCPACRPDQSGFCSLEHFNVSHNIAQKKCKKEDSPRGAEIIISRNNDNSSQDVNDTKSGNDASSKSLRNIRFNREIKTTQAKSSI